MLHYEEEMRRGELNVSVSPESNSLRESHQSFSSFLSLCCHSRRHVEHQSHSAVHTVMLNTLAHNSGSMAVQACVHLSRNVMCFTVFVWDCVMGLAEAGENNTGGQHNVTVQHSHLTAHRLFFWQVRIHFGFVLWKLLQGSGVVSEPLRLGSGDGDVR